MRSVPCLVDSGGVYHDAGEAAAKGANIILLQELFETQYFPQVQDVGFVRPFLFRPGPCWLGVVFFDSSSGLAASSDCSTGLMRFSCLFRL